MAPDLTRYEERLAFMKQQAAQVSRDRANLHYILWVGAAVTLGATVFRPLAGLGALAITGVTWTMGLYFTTVRRFEMAAHVAEAEQILADKRAAAMRPDPSRRPGP